MADIERLERELRENLASFDAEVAYELENEGERADLWTDIDVPVEAIRALLDELSRLRDALEWIARKAPQPTGDDAIEATIRFFDLQNYASATLAHLPFVSHEDMVRALRESLPTAGGE